MMHSNGISYEGDLLDLGLQYKVLERSGSWLRYGDQQLGQGRERAREYLKDNRDLAEEIRGLVMAANGFGEPVEEGASGEDVDEDDTA